MSPPESTPRRIAVILGPGAGSRYLLDQIRPLLATDPGIELQGMFLREANVQHAAELPFVKELCRVTFTVREFDSGQFERALALRMRTARQALSLLAERVGVAHTFRDVRGSAVGLIAKAISDSHITVFEPARPPLTSAMPSLPDQAAGPRIVAILSDPESSPGVLNAAADLAGGELSRVAVLLLHAPEGEVPSLRRAFRAGLGGEPGHVRLVAGNDYNDLALTLRELYASMLVVPASPGMSSEKSLHFLHEQVRCPVCIVRNWAH